MHEERLIGIVCRAKRLKREMQFADHWVVDALAAARFVSDVAGGPPAPKVWAVHRQLADERSHRRVVGMAAGVEAEVSDDCRSIGSVPVGVEGMRVDLAEEDQARPVAKLVRQRAEVDSIHGGAEPVPGEYVHASADHYGGQVQAVEYLQQLRADPLRARQAPSAGHGIRERPKVRSLIVVELKRPGDGIQDSL